MGNSELFHSGGPLACDEEHFSDDEGGVSIYVQLRGPLVQALSPLKSFACVPGAKATTALSSQAVWDSLGAEDEVHRASTAMRRRHSDAGAAAATTAAGIAVSPPASAAASAALMSPPGPRAAGVGVAVRAAWARGHTSDGGGGGGITFVPTDAATPAATTSTGPRASESSAATASHAAAAAAAAVVQLPSALASPALGEVQSPAVAVAAAAAGLHLGSPPAPHLQQQQQQQQQRGITRAPQRKPSSGADGRKRRQAGAGGVASASVAGGPAVCGSTNAELPRSKRRKRAGGASKGSGEQAVRVFGITSLSQPVLNLRSFATFNRLVAERLGSSSEAP